jgi:hypothetical protein
MLLLLYATVIALHLSTFLTILLILEAICTFVCLKQFCYTYNVTTTICEAHPFLPYVINTAYGSPGKFNVSADCHISIIHIMISNNNDDIKFFTLSLPFNISVFILCDILWFVTNVCSNGWLELVLNCQVSVSGLSTNIKCNFV